MTNKFPAYAAIAIFLLVLAGMSYYIWMNRNIPPENSTVNVVPTTVQTAVETPVSPTSEVNMYPGSTQFKSSSNGIAFNYLPSSNGAQISVKESGNKIYVYNTSMAPETGQSVEIFQKSADQSLEDAVRMKFLATKLETDCWVETTTSNYKNFPASYKIAEISFPKTEDSQEPWWSNSSKCSEYAQSNGIRYFLEDTAHPGRYVFLNIGQYAILAGDGIPWQNTIRFFDQAAY